MIVVMKPEATADQIDGVAAHITALGMTPQVIRGTETTVIAAIGEEREGLAEALEPGAGVEKVLPIRAPTRGRPRSSRPRGPWSAPAAWRSAGRRSA